MPSSSRRIVAILAVLLFSAGVLSAVEPQQKTFDRTLNVTGPVEMEISTGAGHINVHAGASNTVLIHGTVQASNDWGGDAQERIARIVQNPPIEQQGNSIRVGHFDDREIARNISISYDVTVPAATRLNSSTGSGPQSIDGIAGPLKASTGSGTLKIGNIGADVRATSGSGNITVDGAKGAVTAATGSGEIIAHRVGGAFHATTGSGQVEMDQAAAGDIGVNTGSGDVQLRNVKGGVRIGTGSGAINVSGEMTADWKFSSASGSINVDLPGNAAFELSARSVSGRVNVARELVTQGDISRGEVHGKVGGGGPLLEAHTASGSINVR